MYAYQKSEYSSCKKEDISKLIKRVCKLIKNQKELIHYKNELGNINGKDEKANILCIDRKSVV